MKHEHFHQELDRPNVAFAFAIGGIALFLFAAFVWWAFTLNEHTTHRLLGGGVVPITPQMSAPNQGMLHRTTFEAHAPEAERDRQRRLLGSYGWVDPMQGVIRIPVERAIDILSEEQ